MYPFKKNPPIPATSRNNRKIAVRIFILSYPYSFSRPLFFYRESEYLLE
jgi:hypothetical protein